MKITWNPEVLPPTGKIGFMGWICILFRGPLLIFILLAGVALTGVIRLVERPLFGLRRPVTPFITQAVCRLAFVVLGIGREAQGRPMNRPGAVVANHSSWLDIFALNAQKRIYFVSKSEVANWPGIGLLARITGTVFITRDPKLAKQQTALFEARLLAGHKLLFFPEGTSTDGMRILPFKTTLFQSFFGEKLRHDMHIQPVSVIYQNPQGADARFYGWWGAMDFAPHLLQVMAQPRQGKIKIIYHPPVKVDEFANRKTLAAHLEGVVRGGMPEARRIR